MNIMRKTTHHGFTLVEVLVYIAVLVVVAMGGVASLLGLSSSIARNTMAREMNESAALTLERIVRDIRNSETVDTGASTLGSSPGEIALVNGATTTSFSVSGGRIIIEENGTVLGPISDDSVTVDSFVARHYTSVNTELVRVVFTLSYTSGRYSDTRTYYGSAVLRGSYE